MPSLGKGREVLDISFLFVGTRVCAQVKSRAAEVELRSQPREL